jgi:hypothetical protein
MDRWFFPNTNHLKQQIETHEESMTHKEATKHYAQIKAGKGVSMLNEAGIAKAKNFWRLVLHRIIVIILTLASCLCLYGDTGNLSETENAKEAIFLVWLTCS